MPLCHHWRRLRDWLVNSSPPHQPSCAANVAPFRYAPSAGLNPLSRSTRSHGHCLPCAVSWSPNVVRIPPERIGSKAGIAPASAQRSAASLIRGTALQRLLGTGLAILFVPVWRTGVTFRSVCFAVGGLPAGYSCSLSSNTHQASRRACAPPGDHRGAALQKCSVLFVYNADFGNPRTFT